LFCITLQKNFISLFLSSSLIAQTQISQKLNRLPQRGYRDSRRCALAEHEKEATEAPAVRSPEARPLFTTDNF
jgi:hypothetical protein